MFSGVSTLNLDSKGRLAIPAKHRELLSVMSENRVMITLNPEGCLLIYPKIEWLPVYEQLRKLSGTQAGIARVILGFAEELELDSAGRILVPTKLRELAGLDKEVALVGQGNKFELWSEQAHLAKIRQTIAEDEVSDEMQTLKL